MSNDLRRLAEQLVESVYGPTMTLDAEGDGYLLRSESGWLPLEPGGYNVRGVPVRTMKLPEIIRRLTLDLRAKHERDSILIDEASQALLRAEADKP